MTSDVPVLTPHDHYYWPNKLGRIYLLSLEDVMGRNGINSVLNLAKLRHLISNYPPDNLDLGWSFDEMAALNQAIDDMHGQRGGKGLAVRTGRAAFYYFVKDFSGILGISDITFRLQSSKRKVRTALNAIADTFNKTSDQVVEVEGDADHVFFVVERCPVCWSRTSEGPICHAIAGLLQEGLHWATGGKSYRVEETACIAMGDSSCTYTVDRHPLE
jgi:predicted hydrocarbon binding protein